MTLSRNFRSQTWFVRLPTGELDLLDGASIERALTAGALSQETPVCAVGTQAWMPLRLLTVDDVAGNEAVTIIPSGEVEVASPDGPWCVRDRQLPSFKARKSPLYAAFMATTVAVVVLGLHLSSALAGQAAKQAPASSAVAMVRLPSEEATPPAPPKAAVELTPEQRQRLRALDRKTAITKVGDLRRARPSDVAHLRATGMLPPKR